MNQLYADSIKKARSYYTGYDDILHDLSHTERVVENAKEIAGALGYKDLEFLELCGYWHDVARTRGKEPHEEAGAVMARQDLLSRGADEDLAKRAYEAIRFHKSSANPVTTEGKIIRDADKLEIFSVIRWEKCEAAGWPKDCIENLKKTIDNLPRYPDLFSFDFTKRLYEGRLAEFQKYYDSIKSKLPS